MIPAIPNAAAAKVDVTVTNYAFTPSSIEIHVGDTVSWTNNAGTQHTTTSQGNWDLTLDANGGSASRTFQAAGDFSYVCRYHSSMTGVVHVLAAVENNPPSVTITSPTTEHSVAGVVPVAFSAQDADGDSISVNLRVDSGTWHEVPQTNGAWVYSWDTTAITNGVHTLTARASDGKTQTLAPSISLTVANPPTIALTSPDDGANVTLGSNLTIAGRAGSALGTTLAVEVSLDGGTWIPASGSSLWSYTWNTSSFTEGNHTVQARASDGTTLVLSPVRTISVYVPPPPPPDAPPEIEIVSPAPGSSAAGLVNVTGTASDPDGTVPSVEISVNGGPWEPATGRHGDSWWFALVPDGVPPGSVAISARASDASSTVSTTRTFQLDGTPRALDVEVAAARTAHPLALRVLSAANVSAPIAEARVILANVTGDTLGEAVTDDGGNASFPALPAGNYTLRAYAPGAFSTIDITVRSLYDVTVTPESAPFDDVVAFVVHVESDGPARNVPIQLRGAILPGNESGTGRSARDGNVTFGLQPLLAGALEVWVAGNDTGVRATITPALTATFSPADPIVDENVTAKLTYNDLAHTPAPNVDLWLDLPRASQPQNVTSGPDATITFLAHAPGMVGLRPAGSPRPLAQVLVLPPRATAELHDLTARPGPGFATASVVVKNTGESARGFIVDVVALGANGAAVQAAKQTSYLDPGAEEKETMTLKIGPGEYDIVASVAASNATARSTVHVVDSGIPTVSESSQSDAPVVAPTPAKSKLLPLGWALAPASLVVAGLLTRRRR